MCMDLVFIINSTSNYIFIWSIEIDDRKSDAPSFTNFMYNTRFIIHYYCMIREWPFSVKELVHIYDLELVLIRSGKLN